MYIIVIQIVSSPHAFLFNVASYGSIQNPGVNGILPARGRWFVFMEGMVAGERERSCVSLTHTSTVYGT